MSLPEYRKPGNFKGTFNNQPALDRGPSEFTNMYITTVSNQKHHPYEAKHPRMDQVKFVEDSL